MNTVTLRENGDLLGMTPSQIAEMYMDFAQYDAVRRIERWSIREFMRECHDNNYFRGKTLDYGCGEQPYSRYVAGEYIPYYPAKDTLQTLALLNGRVDTIMCNQVTQYVPNVPGMLARFYKLLKPRGHVVITFATNWDEVEPEDLHRFTARGMESMLASAGFELIVSVRRAEVAHGLFKFPLGHGMVARRRPE